MKRTLCVVLLGTLLLLPPLALGGETLAPRAAKIEKVCCSGECLWTDRAMDYFCTARAVLRLAWRITRDLVRDASQKDVSITHTSASVVKQIAVHGATNWLASGPLDPLTRPSAGPVGSGHPVPGPAPLPSSARGFCSRLRINR